MQRSAIFGAGDLRALCGTGVPVSFDGVARYPDGLLIRGLLDRSIQNKLSEQGFGGVDVALPELRLPFNAFNPMPRNGDVLLVDGEPFEIYDTTAEDDGSFLCFYLKRPR